MILFLVGLSLISDLDFSDLVISDAYRWFRTVISDGIMYKQA